MNILKKWIGFNEIRVQIATLTAETQILKKEIHTQNEQLLEMKESIDTLIRSTALNTKSIQSVSKSLIGEREENDIEKESSDAIDVTDGQRIPIVSGMKVRFETEGVDTEIGIT